MENGLLQEVGTHQELLARKGLLLCPLPPAGCLNQLNLSLKILRLSLQL